MLSVLFSISIWFQLQPLKKLEQFQSQGLPPLPTRRSPHWFPTRPQLHFNCPNLAVAVSVSVSVSVCAACLLWQTARRPGASPKQHLAIIWDDYNLARCLLQSDEWTTTAAGVFEWKLKIFTHKFAAVWMNVSANKERALPAWMHLS